MKVLVTGGTGFIGSAIVPRLIANGHEIMVYDIAAWDEKAERIGWYIKGEIFEDKHFDKVLSCCDIYMVRLGDAGVAQDHPQMSFDPNIIKPRNLLLGDV